MTTHQEALEAAERAYMVDATVHDSVVVRSRLETAIRAYLSTLAPADNGLVEKLLAAANEYPIRLTELRHTVTEAADALTASQADRTALAAENERLRAELEMSRASVNNLLMVNERGSKRAASLQTLLDKAVEDLEDIAERPGPNESEGAFWRSDAARSTITAIKEATHVSSE